MDGNLTQSPSAATNDQPRPLPLGGWLRVAALNVYLAPLIMLILLFRSYRLFITPGIFEVLSDRSLPTYDPLILPMIFLEVASQIALFYGWFYAGMLFSRRSIRLPRWVDLLAVSTLLFDCLELLLQTQLRSPTGHATPFEVRRSLFAICTSAIWIIYFTTSQRVKRTFVRHP